MLDRIIVFDWNCYVHSLGFAKSIDEYFVNYMIMNMLTSNIRKIGYIPGKDTLVIAKDWVGGNWRKDYERCLDSETEILTCEGWMSIKDVVERKYDKKIATLDLAHNKVVYKNISNFYSYEYSGDMYRCGGFKCRVDLLMTPNHSHLLKKPGENQFYLKDIKDFNGRMCEHFKQFNYIKKTGLKFFTLPKLVRKSISWRKGIKYTIVTEYPAKKIPIKLWIKLLGWYLTEGCVMGRRYCGVSKPGVVAIPQSVTHNPKYCKEIFKILSKFGGMSKCKRTNIITYTISNTQLADYLRNNFGTAFHKRIPRKLLNSLSKRQCQLLLSTLIKGDGTYKKQIHSYAYTTASKQLANDVQELALKAGFSCTITLPAKKRNWYGLSISKNYSPKNYISIIKNWSGMVYDIEVPNHIFYIRRRGKCCWTGNSYKANRKENRDKSGKNWNLIYSRANVLLEEFEFAGFQKIEAPLMEADDLIALLPTKYPNHEIVVVSIDSDLEQLWAYPNVKLFSLKKRALGQTSKGAYKIRPNTFDVYGLIAKKIKKETSDNLITPVVTEEEYNNRKMCVDLINLPDFVREACDNVLASICLGQVIQVDVLSYPKLCNRFMDAQFQDSWLTYEQCAELESKKKIKTKRRLDKLK